MVGNAETIQKRVSRTRCRLLARNNFRVALHSGRIPLRGMIELGKHAEPGLPTNRIFVPHHLLAVPRGVDRQTSE